MGKFAAVIAFAAAVAACAAFVGCGGGEKGNQTTPSQPGAPGNQVAATAGKAQTLCPVMGGAIDKSIFVDYEGKRVYFCCGMCPPKFKSEPEKYMTAMAKGGIVLDKAPEGSK